MNKNEFCKEEDGFQIIDENNDFLSYSYHQIISNNDNKKKEEIKTNQNLDLSSWNIITNKLNNFKNILTYNIFSTQKILKAEEYESLRLFDKIYVFPENSENFEEDFNNLIWMSYRSNFPVIINGNDKFTSDCGWGCMIRCGQMILSQAILFIKHSDQTFKQEEHIHRSTGRNLQDIVALFMDGPISTDQTKENTSFSMVSISSSMKFEIVKVAGNSKVTPAFSILNICQKGLGYNRGAGQWFSDVTIVNIFKELNDELNPLKNLKIFNFIENVVYENSIIKECFEEIDEYIEIENSAISSNPNFSDENTLIFNEKTMNFKNPGIIFISLRLGLDRIEKRYFESVKKIFNIPFNLGFIGGEEGRAFYFIGITDKNEFIYMDPHFNQKSPLDLNDLEININSYKPKNLFLMDFENLSPAITLGFYFRNASEYKTLKLVLKDFSEIDPIFKINASDKKSIEITNQIIEGDFLLLNY